MSVQRQIALTHNKIIIADIDDLEDIVLGMWEEFEEPGGEFDAFMEHYGGDELQSMLLSHIPSPVRDAFCRLSGYPSTGLSPWMESWPTITDNGTPGIYVLIDQGVCKDFSFDDFRNPNCWVPVFRRTFPS